MFTYILHADLEKAFMILIDHIDYGGAAMKLMSKRIYHPLEERWNVISHGFGWLS